MRDAKNRHCEFLQEWLIQWTAYIICCHQRETASYWINCVTINSILFPMPELLVFRIHFSLHFKNLSITLITSDIYIYVLIVMWTFIFFIHLLLLYINFLPVSLSSSGAAKQINSGCVRKRRRQNNQYLSRIWKSGSFRFFAHGRWMCFVLFFLTDRLCCWDFHWLSSCRCGTLPIHPHKTLAASVSGWLMFTDTFKEEE